MPEQHDPTPPAVKPLCPVFGQCRGCAYQDIPYEEELKIKERALQSLLTVSLDIPEEKFAALVASPKPYHYRNRLDLKLKRTREKGVLIGFTPVDRRGVLPVEACFIAEKSISDFIPELKKQALARLPAQYRIANLTVRTGEDGRVFWGGIGRRSCALAESDYLFTHVNGRKIFYSLDTFFQANLSILPELFNVIGALDCWDPKPVFFDLYGGVGLFALGLAEKVERAFLIEENPSSVKCARHNLKTNDIHHLTLIEGKVEDALPRFLDEVPGKKKVVLIDPPRAGLSPQACRYLAKAHDLTHILYLSCRPESLARDLKTFLKEGWDIKTVIPFDFFPKTKHLETLVWLTSH